MLISSSALGARNPLWSGEMGSRDDTVHSYLIAYPGECRGVAVISWNTLLSPWAYAPNDDIGYYYFLLFDS
jgi:hypothetical protein